MKQFGNFDFSKKNINQTFKSKISSFSSKFSIKNPQSPSTSQNQGFGYFQNNGSEISSPTISNPDILDLDSEVLREVTIEGNDGGQLSEYVNSKIIYEAGWFSLFNRKISFSLSYIYINSSKIYSLHINSNLQASIEKAS
ncbi:hypothetical protein AYI70_g3465 [Smittium culicis]|uniref:Uncharacterized protein n=1 Tax=Smittium culicis TaxID=133412 RepID=A0A1R1Y3W7_9FUNG|nr:hypothetical protein AYI70_g3465 [Smittium culicis]